MRRLRVIFPVLVVLLTFPAEGQADQSLSLQEALNRALEANPELRIARSQVDRAEARKTQLRSSILPHLSLEGRTTFNDRSVEFELGEAIATILPRNDWRAEIRMTQPVFSGGRELRAIRQAGLGIEDAAEGLRGTREGLLLSTTADYLGVIEGDALVDVERKNVELAQRRLEQARAFYEAGETTRVDLLRAETAIRSAERRLTAASQERASAASRLRIDLAMDVPVAVSEPEIDLAGLPPTEALVDRAVAAHPSVQRARLAVKFHELEVSKQRRKYLPTVTSEASYVAQASDFPAGEYGSFTLNFSLPIFDSFDIASQVRIAKEDLKQARLQLEAIERSVRESVELSLVDLEAAETNLALARQQLEAAQAEYEQMFELYRAQEATTLDLEAAETTLADARRAVVVGTIDLDLARLAAWYAAGSLEEALMAEALQ
ncbi:MAG: TolC family protein [Thermoanaerobaculia bacterium]|nr:TolC family protein [Thermoanaerobaculia bacterium]